MLSMFQLLVQLASFFYKLFSCQPVLWPKVSLTKSAHLLKTNAFLLVLSEAWIRFLNAEGLLSVIVKTDHFDE